MKRENFIRGAVVLALAAGLAAGLTGCSATRRSQASDAESSLRAAGFRSLTTNTKERIDALQTLTPLQLKPVTRNGQTYYVYPDPYNCQCLWVGGEKELQEYQQLRFERTMKKNDLVARGADANLPETYWEGWESWSFSYH